MPFHIELSPEDEAALCARARMSGRDLASYVRKIILDHIDHGDAIAGLDDLIDHEAVAFCAREIEGKDVPSLEEVRRAPAGIPGAMAQAVIEERDERC
jgi:hypothetical protein